jgi:hypothetical protein
MMEAFMRGMFIKLGVLLAIWYEVSVELGLASGTAFVVTLLGFGAGMMLLRLPGQILALLGPPAVQLIGPAAVWAGLVWWLMPGTFNAYPAFTLMGGGVLVMLGAAGHYVLLRYSAWFAPRWPMLRGLLSPAGCLVLLVVDTFGVGFLKLTVVAALLAMPLRVGWRFIAPAIQTHFDARMGNEESFRRSGSSADR